VLLRHLCRYTLVSRSPVHSPDIPRGIGVELLIQEAGERPPGELPRLPARSSSRLPGALPDLSQPYPPGELRPAGVWHRCARFLFMGTRPDRGSIAGFVVCSRPAVRRFAAREEAGSSPHPESYGRPAALPGSERGSRRPAGTQLLHGAARCSHHLVMAAFFARNGGPGLFPSPWTWRPALSPPCE
jgi:hypothetical protein